MVWKKLLLTTSTYSIPEDGFMNTSFDQFIVTNAQGQTFPFSNLQGKVVLIVNIATKCGKAPQLKGMESLYQTYRDQGFEILAFPCNQFLFQNLISAEKTEQVCALNYGVSFRIMEKIKVNGWRMHPLYHWLKSQAPGRIQWNFTKFLIDRNGQVAGRFGPNVQPKELVDLVGEFI